MALGNNKTMKERRREDNKDRTSEKGKFKAVTDYVRDVELKALSLGGRPDTVLKILHAFYDLPLFYNIL
jgi:hypothetical protein